MGNREWKHFFIIHCPEYAVFLGASISDLIRHIFCAKCEQRYPSRKPRTNLPRLSINYAIICLLIRHMLSFSSITLCKISILCYRKLSSIWQLLFWPFYCLCRYEWFRSFFLCGLDLEDLGSWPFKRRYEEDNKINETLINAIIKRIEEQNINISRNKISKLDNKWNATIVSWLIK